MRHGPTAAIATTRRLARTSTLRAMKRKCSATTASATASSATSYAQQAEARLQAEAASWNAPTDPAEIPWAEEADIPVLDLGPYFSTSSSSSDLDAAAAALRAAAESTGFHFIANHGVADSLVADVLAHASRLFALPDADKALYAMDTPPAHANEVRAGCGYLCHGNIKLPAREKANYNEAFVVKQEVGPRDVTLAKMPWPDERRFPSVAGFRASVEAYAAAMEDLARRMLPIYAVALNLPPTYFAPMFEEPLFRMRLSQYAPSPADEYGINPHVDTSFFTILRPTGPGLVVQHVKRRNRRRRCT